MDFFGIGAGEVLLIIALALIIWGPHKLPGIARTMGKTVRALKKATYDLTSEVTKEIDNIDSKEKEPTSPTKQASDTKPKHS